MFRRLIFEDSAAYFTIAAFITAFTIYATFAWQALRMKRGQVERFGNLPFETSTPAASVSHGRGATAGGRESPASPRHAAMAGEAAASGPIQS